MKLYLLPSHAKKAIVAFLFLLTSGVLFGLVYLSTTTGMSPTGTAAHYAGDPVTKDELDMHENYAKPLSEMLITTHNHLIGFAYIFALTCGLFYFNSIIEGPLKGFLLVEPFISVLITFLSLWGIRFVNPAFAVIAIAGGILTYFSYFLIVSILVFELVFKKDATQISTI
ncbi:MAG: hypothetical protein DWQ05_06360 [Calditrichaeota bacterium]|nr:MAG: hypothetical protein DWQ05_06360 [Calditrichota bacterium]